MNESINSSLNASINNSAENDEKKQSYSFQEVPTSFTHNSNHKWRDLFCKWNLSPGLLIPRFVAKPRIRSDDNLVELIHYFLSDPIVGQKLNLPTTSSSSLSGSNSHETGCSTEIKNLSMSFLSCSCTDMKFFDPLISHDIITETGYIRGCMDDNLTVQDKVREMLINPESRNSTVFTPKQKKEFLFHLFRLICIGGSMCQAEEVFQDWKNAIKNMYKDLVTVYSDSEGKTQVSSKVYHIDPEGYNISVFPRKSSLNRCYVVVDVSSNLVTVIYKPFEPFW